MHLNLKIIKQSSDVNTSATFRKVVRNTCVTQNTIDSVRIFKLFLADISFISSQARFQQP